MDMLDRVPSVSMAPHSSSPDRKVRQSAVGAGGHESTYPSGNLGAKFRIQGRSLRKTSTLRRQAHSQTHLKKYTGVRDSILQRMEGLTPISLVGINIHQIIIISPDIISAFLGGNLFSELRCSCFCVRLTPPKLKTPRLRKTGKGDCSRLDICTSVDQCRAVIHGWCRGMLVRGTRNGALQVGRSKL